ncbi:MAG: PPC domain-containing DNA-binding protein [Desulfovibrionaceae bacterium]
MKVDEGRIGRIFVLRLEDGDRIPNCIESFAASNKLARAACWLVGGIGSGQIVVGPEDTAESGDDLPPVPMIHNLQGVHEAAAVGTIFPDESGMPRLHMHAALGRNGGTRTGCVRPGVNIWTVGEVVIMEMLDLDMIRKRDQATGFELLDTSKNAS